MGFLKRHWQWFLGGAIALAWWRLSSGTADEVMIQSSDSWSKKEKAKAAGF